MDDRYEFIDTKSVLDSDGFLTDYTMYKDTETGMYVFIFGDNDFYGPDEGSVDWECETFEEAYEWFNDYNGFDEELDEIEECESIHASSYGEEDFEGTDIQDDLLSMKNELERIYYRLDSLKAKWENDDIVWDIQDTIDSVGKAFTTLNTALRLL